MVQTAIELINGLWQDATIYGVAGALYNWNAWKAWRNCRPCVIYLGLGLLHIALAAKKVFGVG